MKLRLPLSNTRKTAAVPSGHRKSCGVFLLSWWLASAPFALVFFAVAVFAGGVTPKFAFFQIQPIQSGPPASPPAAMPAAPRPVTLPAGTEIHIRTIDEINSKSADEYKEYAASLDAPVQVNGVTVLPAQTRAFFKATDIVKPGLKRRASLSLSLVAVMVSGQRVRVETSKLESKGGPQGTRTGKAAVIGGATGAVFGAIFGGGMGAGIGAAVGAGAGAIASRFFRAALVIPSESRFTYKLTQDAVLAYQAAPPSQTETAGGAQQTTAPETVQPPIPAPPRPPVETQELSLGESPEQVVRDFGKPDKIVPDGAKEIYIYKDMKVTFTDGKVTNVE